MDISSTYTQIQPDATLLRQGGLILKGQTRHSRQPVHLLVLVDTSGSMELENKLSSVQKSLQFMLELLSPEDRLSLVTFADDSKTFLSRAAPTPDERQAILYRIQKLKADGSTNMSAGLLEARALVEPPTSGRKQGLILLTDGHANIGVHTEEGLIEILKRIQSESPGLSLTTVAYGVDHNAEMLTNLAKAGGGAYNVVNTLEDVATVFGDILGGLISVSAQKVEVQLPPGAEAKTSFRTETDDAGMTTVYVGDLYADAEITILFKSSPSRGPLRVKGTDMTTLNPIDTICDPTPLHSLEDIPLSLIVAEYRQQVVELLQRMRTDSHRPDPEALRSEIQALLRTIEDQDRIRTHPLRPILLEDLQQALQRLERGHDFTQLETVEMAQHSAYLGMARGLRTQTSQVARAPSPVRRGRRGRRMSPGLVGAAAALPPSPPLAAAPPPPMASPFANRMQTQLASAMRAMSTQEPEETSQ